MEDRTMQNYNLTIAVDAHQDILFILPERVNY
jgi:hypothetical protein